MMGMIRIVTERVEGCNYCVIAVWRACQRFDRINFKDLPMYCMACTPPAHRPSQNNQIN